MKKLLNLSVLGLLVLSGCQPTATEPTDVEPTPDSTEETETSETTDNGWLSFGELSFYLPDGWTVAQEMQGSEGVKKATLNVPDSQYEVQLAITMTEGTTYDEGEPLAQNQEAKVYLVPCGGAYACYALVFMDEYKREFDFDILSNEPAPENLDGIWSPSTEVTREELIQFLLSVGLTPENK